MLHQIIRELPEEDARYHMKRCVDSGLWVPSKEPSSLALTSSSLLLVFLENAFPSKCTTRPSTKPDLETTLVSTLRDFQRKTCPRLETSCPSRELMVTMIHQKPLRPSEPPFSSKTTLDN